ncbi:phosphatidate cytidylyltransferase [Niveibacterium microcysteis]|uniref:Phosphatidate cytidylyltransferase n=1 Tax=Niveibacterium microcysteis TaxID=2811415 RepID=A0ABX7M042_9RHOO|nr:phosphatidate cytidylyltransferase [Niveibacterium microcysteis]QSI75135.1 phosphatidate cytidylyltransferase [Niveibacterium microcysteis]
MLRERVITALLMLAGLLAAVFYLPTNGWWIACGALGLAAAWEWAGLFHLPSAVRWGYGVVVAAAVVAFAAIASPAIDAALFVLSALFWMLVAPPWLKQRWRLSGGAVLPLILGLVILLPSAVALARLREANVWLMLAVMAVVWVADIAAYFGGRAFGRRKLAPEISPGKSWEGVYSGLAGVLLYGAVVFSVWMPFVPQRLGWPIALMLLLALSALSVIGDLFESLLKRQAGLKDSSGLLPGHGGVLDRIDSLTSTLPLVALWALVWRLAGS